MIKSKKETVTYTETTETYYCDICKKKLDVDVKATIEAIKGYSNYGTDGGFKEGYAYDFCIKCFEKEILPFLKQKADPREIDEDW